MKGTIVVCLQELVEKRFGKPAWDTTLAEAGAPGANFVATADVPDATVMNILGALSKVAQTPAKGLTDAFGDYWANEYAPRVYAPYFLHHETAMAFLLGMDGVHQTMTKTIPNARPPRFSYERKGDKTLVMTYQSPRNLGAMLPGLIHGVARHYRTRCTVREAGANRFEITFL